MNSALVRSTDTHGTQAEFLIAFNKGGDMLALSRAQSRANMKIRKENDESQELQMLQTKSLVPNAGEVVLKILG